MPKLVWFRLMVAAFCLLPAAAYADPMVIKNELNDNETSFVWTITFTGLPAIGSDFLIQALYLNPPIEWGGIKTGTPMTMSIDENNGNFFIQVDGRHLDGPHNVPGNFDIDPGEDFHFALNLNRLTEKNMRLAFDVVEHLHTVGAHSDFVELFGSRGFNNEFTFVVTGTHRNVSVPEPATMLLLGTGLAGIAIKTRKRLKVARAKENT